MDQQTIGSFLKALRKEKNLTQEQLAEKLNVSNRTVSRWECGSNLPDIGMLVEIAEFFDVSIPEIIKGERKSEIMTQETKDTAEAIAQYGKNEVKNGKKKIAGILLMVFGAFVIMSALAVFPADSSWGSIYSIIGSIVALVGVFILTSFILRKLWQRILTVAVCIVLLFAAFSVMDYVSVRFSHQVPRFMISAEYSSTEPDRLVYKTLFFTAVRENPGTKDETVNIIG